MESVWDLAQLLYHPGDRRRAPVNACGVTT